MAPYDPSHYPTKQPSSAPPRQKQEAVGNFSFALMVMCFMIVLGAMVLLGRLGAASQWAGLMETAGFKDWPSMGGSTVQFAACVVSLVGSAVPFLVLCCLSGGLRPVEVRVATLFVFAAGIAAIVGALALCVTTSGATAAMVNQLATQAEAATAFNRAYCEAWCRHEGTLLGALLEGECGEIKTTVFDDVVGYLKVGDWCKEAIAQQNYDAVASHAGTSPVAGLKDRRPETLTTTVFSDIGSILNGFLGIVLLVVWCERERHYIE